MAEQAQRLLLDRFALPSLIVNRRGEVVYCAHGRLGDYVEPPEGRPTAQLVGLVRETDPEVQRLLANPYLTGMRSASPHEGRGERLPNHQRCGITAACSRPRCRCHPNYG